MNPNQLHLELHVPDFEKVKDFYGKLGFRVVWENKPEGQKGYLVMDRQGATVSFLGDGEFDGTKLQADLRQYHWLYVCRTASTIRCHSSGYTAHRSSAIG